MSATDKICTAMLSILQREPFDQITVKELVVEANVSRSSYNYNFSSMNNVLEKISDGFASGIVSMLDTNYRDAKVNGKLTSVYEDIFQYVYEQRDSLRIMTHAGFLDLIQERLTSALYEFYCNWNYRYTDAKGNQMLLQEGMIYNLKNMENAYRLVADIIFWAKYDYALPAEFMTEMAGESRSVHITSAEAKKTDKK